MWMPQEVIRRKRDGLALDAEDIGRVVAGIGDASLGDAQVAAFAMAVYLRGMSLGERVALTAAMRDSGQTLQWDVPGPVVDKHSTGGVGDCVSLILAPLLAACGCYVPMISGRGLGHTGGTLDKLESIPGYDCSPTPERLRQVVGQVGCAIVGQTASLAPADKRLYAIRDVTGTVESIDLITASILGKKLAAGVRVLVMDVKTGNGAFMAELAAARELAGALVTVGNGAGLLTGALVTDMSQPLARSAGNALEVAEAIALLKGQVRSERLWAVTLALGEQALVLAGKADTLAKAREQLLQAWRSGAALQRFGAMVQALGGPADLIAEPDRHLPLAPIRFAVWAQASGHVIGVDTRNLGLAVVALGGGRHRVEDRIDACVGFSDLAMPGESVGEQRPLGWVHASSQAQAEEAANALRAAYRLGPEAVVPQVLVHEWISPAL
jgi:thymidine phosphorylase